MIQRIQSIYLLLGALALIALLFLDTVWESAAAEALAWFSPVLLLLGGLTALAAVGAIFLYKDRKRQRQVVVWVLFLTIAFIVVFFLGLFLVGELVLVDEEGLDWGRIVALLLPVAAYVCFSLARRAIDRDIALVRSMDRLR